MKWVMDIVLIVSVLFLSMMLFDAAQEEMPEFNGEYLRHNISRLNDNLFNITEAVPYTNLYENEITINATIFNMIHGIFYGVIVQMNTMIPIVIEFASGSYAQMILIVLVLYVVLNFLPRIVIGIIVLYFFIKEKRRFKEKIID